MMPSKRVANISNVITHKTVQIAAQHINESDDGVDGVQDLDGTHLETIDQMDGAFDGDLSESDDIFTSKQATLKKKSLVNVPIKRSNKLKFNRNIKKTIPRYVKMGLFGGAPPDDEDNGPESTTEAAESTEIIEQPCDDIKMEETAEENTQKENANEEQGDQPAEEQSAEPINSTEANELNETSGSDGDAQQDANATETGADAVGTDETTTAEEPQLKLEPRSTTEPTPSDTEAANILTTIKSGEMLRHNDLKTENIIITPSTTGTIKVSSPSDDVVKILFNNEPAVITTTKNGSAKSSQKSTNSFIASNTGHLDALASAALQASSGKCFIIILCLLYFRLARFGRIFNCSFFIHFQAQKITFYYLTPKC